MFSSVKGKRTQKRNLKHGPKKESKSDLGEAEDKGNSEISNPEHTTTPRADEINSGEISSQFLMSVDIVCTKKRGNNWWRVTSRV